MLENGTIFDKISLNREEVDWTDYLRIQTPVQQHEKSFYLKRDDWFAPLGYGGINGSKLRQLIYLVNKNKDKKILISATSLLSPQLAMGSAVSKYFGMESIHVIGATKPETAIKKPMVQMATWFGAKWDIINIGYNHNLQLKAQELHKKYSDSFYLEYGITLNHKTHPIEEIFNFHEIGANQVKSLENVDCNNLVVPFGSSNSATSIVLGLFLYPPKNIKTIYFFGIGPSKFYYFKERL